jgi:ribonuclease HII
VEFFIYIHYNSVIGGRVVKASMRLENSLRREGHLFVCGIDEVGRGCLAGPLVAGAVILPAHWKKPLKDSKLLTESARVELNEYILQKSLANGIGWVENTEIDEIGLTEAVKLAYLRAIEDMDAGFSLAVIDGNYNYLDEFGVAQTLVKADQKMSCVAAASIIAKVARDNYMYEKSTEYNLYDFENNVGYGTKKHREAVATYGITPLHRKSFCRNLV